VAGDDGALNHHASTPLALALHELATNSAKYGAFSTPEGRVDVHGRLEGDTYTLTWAERGGPPVDEPDRFGFGSRRVEVSVQSRLGGELVREWRPEGLQVAISALASAIIAES